jgi:Reverse transcriptase (RNA-dependent DNA polymerase)
MNGTRIACSISLVFFGVPLGSILGPILYVLYIAELESIVDRHEMKLHQYADDCRIYVIVPVSDASAAVDRLSACLADVNRSLSASRLRLNLSKTQVMWLGSHQQLQQVDISEISVLATVVRVTEVARDLGVMTNSEMSLAAHVSAVRRSGFHQLRQLRPLVGLLSVDATKTLVHAFVSSRLDHHHHLYLPINNFTNRMITLKITWRATREA